MPRYTVTIVAPGAEHQTILVPFSPSALVTAFGDELYKRAARNGLNIAKDTHIVKLRLGSDVGPAIDPEDLLTDVVEDPKHETVFAIFTSREPIITAPIPGGEYITLPDSDASSTLSFRIVTAASAKHPEVCPMIYLPQTATIRQLRDNIADELGVPHRFDDNADLYECNCKLADDLTKHALIDNSFLVIHGKSIVERIRLEEITEKSIRAALRSHFDFDVEKTKNVEIKALKTDRHPSEPKIATAIVALCSKKRHVSSSIIGTEMEAKHEKRTVLDLHTLELPLHPSCMDVTLEKSKLGGLAVDGIIDIYCVNRKTTGDDDSNPGMLNAFSVRSHWEPKVTQSSRGMSTFLSSLWVFTSLVRDMRDDESSQDAVFHVFDHLTKFPPALRTLYILQRHSTPTASESAALCHAMYEVLVGFMEHYAHIIGSDQSRVFEGARLLFGFILDKAKALQLSRQDSKTLPYIQSIRSHGLWDAKTYEGVMDPIWTPKGIMEASQVKYFQSIGLLASSNQQVLTPGPIRVSLLSGGMQSQTVVLSRPGNPDIGIDASELEDFGHLSGLGAHNKLAVYMPGQLVEAGAPYLTFDSEAHLAVLVDEQGYGTPTGSYTVFRPSDGKETLQVATCERLIAPLLKAHQDYGTAVFHQGGGAIAKRSIAPDEILMFCVDISGSMGCSDFKDEDDVNEHAENIDVEACIDPALYQRDVIDEAKNLLHEYEGFNDMVAIVSTNIFYERHIMAAKVFDIMRSMLSADIRRHSKEGASGTKSTDLRELEVLWMALKTHETLLMDFFLYHVNAAPRERSLNWTWRRGEKIPQVSTRCTLKPNNRINYLPGHLRCPLSHKLMLDAVIDSEGDTYSYAAITRWYRSQKASPRTGEPSINLCTRPNEEIREQARLWVTGDGIIGGFSHVEGSTKRFKPSEFDLKFWGPLPYGSFTRKVTSSTTLEDLYILAFRGMQGDISSFELRTSTNLYESYTSFETPFEASSTTTLKSLDIQQETDISIKTGDIASNDKKKDQILIEVSDENEKTLDFCYWIDRNTDQTLSSVVWKYWRYRFYRYFRPDDGLEDFPIEEKDLKIELKQKSNDKVSGTIHKRQERISTLLNQHSCPDQVGEPRALVEEEEDGCTVLKLCVVGAESKTNITLSRLDVLKQVLDAMIHRIQRYNYETHIGLITFAAKPMVTIRISHALQGLQQSIANMKAEDDTALWDALLLAKDQLTVYGEKYPHARKRIICISDGIDTKPSKTTAEETYLRLQEVNIVVDSVALGEDDGSEIRALSYLLGGYCFNPISLTGALAMCEQEPFLSLSERPITELSKRHRSGLLEGLETLSSLGNRVAFTTFTRRMAHPRLKDPVLRLEAFANGHNASSIADQSGNRAPGLRILCLLNEIRAMANDAADRYPMYDVYISEADLGFWKVVMRGPEGTAYAAGTFLLHLDAGEGYPTVPPTARFVTKVRHPNVNWTHGRVCHSIMGRDWTPDTSMAGVLGAIYALFFQVEPKDFFDTRMTVSMLRDKARFEQRIHEFVDKYATKSREEWRSELLGSS